jgi:tryptophanyl-tRNA synthetase
MYSEPGTPLFVPVGEDQVSHVELSREIVRRFDCFYGFEIDGAIFLKENELAFKEATGITAKEASSLVVHHPYLDESKAYWRAEIRKSALSDGVANFLGRLEKADRFIRISEVLTAPAVMLTKTPRIPGLDGRKMSKSYGNAITLSETDDDIRKKTKVMVTDPARKRRTDPGNPDVCPVYDWHKLFSSPETLAWAAEGCRSAGIGCIECKAKMADHLIEWIAPIRERRAEYETNPARVLEVIDTGSKRAREVANVTMERVREAVFGWQKKRKEVISNQ